MSEPMIDVDALTVRFRTKTGPFDAVRDASFQVRAGEAFGLVGESGSGKSTVLRALTGLAPIAGGRVAIGGRMAGAGAGAAAGITQSVGGSHARAPQRDV